MVWVFLADVTVGVLMMMKQLVMGDGGRDLEMIGVVVIFGYQF